MGGVWPTSYLSVHCVPVLLVQPQVHLFNIYLYVDGLKLKWQISAAADTLYVSERSNQDAALREDTKSEAKIAAKNTDIQPYLLYVLSI